MNSLISESLGGARAVKTYQLESYEVARARREFARRRGLMGDIVNARATVEPVVMLIGAVAVAAVVAFAALRIHQGALSIEGFAAFIAALIMLAQPARGLSSLSSVLQEGLGAAQRIFELLDEQPKLVEAEGARPLRYLGGRIEFDAVSFYYMRPRESEAGETLGGALNRLDLTVERGATAALVGPSGSGKSTIFNLAARLFDPREGRVLIDGQDVRDVELASLRSQIALVSQEAFLFDDTARANIAVGRLGASADDIEAAARAASAHDFITALPDGYDTRLGDRGAALSGGERQRLALARRF